MGKVFNPPSTLALPKWDFSKPLSEYRDAENQYLADLKEILKKRRPTQKYVGETISFPVADGKAIYMIAGTSPLELVHVPLGDAWGFQYVHRLTKKDVIDLVKKEQAINKIFGRKEK